MSQRKAGGPVRRLLGSLADRWCVGSDQCGGDEIEGFGSRGNGSDTKGTVVRYREVSGLTQVSD